MVKYSKETELRMIKYLRFRDNEPSQCQKSYMPYCAIGKLINKSSSYVQIKCKAMMKEKPKKVITKKTDTQNQSSLDKYKS